MIDAVLDFTPAHARLLEDEISWSARGLMSQIGSLPVDWKHLMDVLESVNRLVLGTWCV